MGEPVGVCGIGAVSSFGASWQLTAAALATGRSAVQPIEHFDATGFPCAVAAPVLLDEASGPDRRTALALIAAEEAWKRAGLGAVGARVGVFVGAESGRVPFRTLVELARAGRGPGAFDHARFQREAAPLAAEVDSSLISASTVASLLAARFGATGPVRTISLACASGAAAIIEGVRAIRLGHCDVALCGGVGADVDPVMLAGFALLGALSERGVSRPFDVRRDGFVLGEGAAMVVLAAGTHDCICEIRGVGRTLDAYRITAPDPEGSGALRAMQLALVDARLASVDYIQAHGTSTPLNDAVEAGAIQRLVGEQKAPLVSSVKGALGHWIAGAGALGVLCACEAITSGRVLPTVGLEQPDPDLPLQHVLGRAVHATVDTALANSFGFGGANCSIVLGRVQ